MTHKKNDANTNDNLVDEILKNFFDTLAVDDSIDQVFIKKLKETVEKPNISIIDLDKAFNADESLE